MLRRVVTGLALTTVSLFVMGGTASASAAVPSPDPYAPPGNVTINITINNLIINFTFVNSTVIINGGGFLPGEPIDIAVSWAGPPGLRGSSALTDFTALAAAERKAAAARADASGNFSASSMTFDRTGLATITATGEISGFSATYTVEVRPENATGAPRQGQSRGGVENNLGSNNNNAGSESGAGAGVAAGAEAAAAQGQAQGQLAAPADQASGGGSSLASTGASIAGPIAIGAAALFSGLVLLFFGTRGVVRRKSGRTAP
jgi:hypothetical protein